MKSKIYTILMVVLAFANAFAASASQQLSHPIAKDQNIIAKAADGSLAMDVINPTYNVLQQVNSATSNRLSGTINLNASAGKLGAKNLRIRLDGVLSFNLPTITNKFEKAGLTLTVNNTNGSNLAKSANAFANPFVPDQTNFGVSSAVLSAANNVLGLLGEPDYRLVGNSNANATAPNLVIAALQKEHTVQGVGCG